MKTEQIYLGYNETFGPTYLTKHSWDCEWYWGFGYLGNQDCHWHIDSIIQNPPPGKHHSNWTDVNHHFQTTWLKQKQWWILRDLFIVAYSLKKTAECYRYGGHNTDHAGPYRVINPDMATKINDDLKTVLDNIWILLHDWRKEWESKRPDIVNLEEKT